jgi:YihY family inner membrane protein
MAEPSPVQSFVQRLGVLLRRMARQAGELHLQNTAASLAFLSLLAIVPIFSIVLSVVAALPVFDSFRVALQEFFARHLFPSTISDTVLEYVNAFAAQASRLSLAGAVLFFATAIGCLQMIDRSLNRIWGAARSRPLAQRLVLYWALLTLAPLAIGASISANGIIVSQWLGGGEFETARRFWFAMLTWLATGIGLLLLYKLAPNTTVRWREAAIGAVVTTVLVEGLRNALGSYLGSLPTYTVIYGAFSVLPVLLLWLFAAWLLVLLGALLASNLRYWSHDIAPSPVPEPAERFADALAIVRLLAERAPQGPGHALPASSWRAVFDDDSTRAERAVRLAASCGYVDRMVAVEPEAAVEGDPVWAEYWSLGRPASELTLAALFAGVWGGPLEGVPVPALDMPLDRWADTAAREGPRAGSGPAGTGAR